MEIEGLVLRNPQGQIGEGIAVLTTHHGNGFHAAIHLVGGGVEHERLRRPQPHRLHHIEAAEGVDLEVFARIGVGGCDRHLGGQVQHHVGLVLPHHRRQRLEIADIHPLEADLGPLLLQPRQVFLGAPAREVVHDGHLPPS